MGYQIPAVAFIEHIAVQKLFGLYDHSIKLRDEPPVTIVAGPNGVGKTTLLSLTRALVNGDFRTVLRHDFELLRIGANTGQELLASPLASEGDGDEEELRLHLELRKRDETTESEVVTVPRQSQELALPPYIEQHAKDVFFDQRMGEFLTVEEVSARYGRPRGRPASPGYVPEWFSQISWKVDFIETKRLDTLIARGRLGRRREIGPAPIHYYLAAVTEALEVARRESTRIRQSRDRNFTRRLLDKASRMSVKEEPLRERYTAIEQLAEQLAVNGLLSDSLDVLPTGKLNPTEKRIVSLFLDDFEAKLEPLLPVSSKVEQLRGVIGNKFLNKRLEIDSVQGIRFLAEPDEHPIAPESLSSGEQHELALISRLLFKETPGTTVLIDEPELSLHVSWQHEMVNDLVEIAQVADLSFVLATHSTAIINGRWELVEELGSLDSPASDP